MDMSTETCTALSAVFPLILIAATQQRRDMHIRIRRLRFTRWVLLVAMAVCLAGLVYSLIGVQIGGFKGVAAIFVWALALIAVGCFGYVILAIHASIEGEEDADNTDQVRQGAAPDEAG